MSAPPKAATPPVILFVVALIAGLTMTAVPDRAEAVPAPGMRANYVFSFFAIKPNASMLRIGTMNFQPDGLVWQSVWEWSQRSTPVRRDVNRFRTNTGYSSSGCGPTPCAVWTAKGFTGPGKARVGKWKLTHGGNRVQINYGTRWQWYEIYALTNYDTYTHLALVASNYPGFRYFVGSAYGSNASLSQGSNFDQIRAVGSPTQNGLRYRLVTDNWDSSIERTSAIQWWNPGNYSRCAANCIKGVNPGKWHSYLVADGPNLGRKMYWYHMLASVARSTTCANPQYGGHTMQLLQVVDDNGTFIGMVGGEASIMARYRGGSILSYYEGIKL